MQEVREPLDAFQADQVQRMFKLLGLPSEEQWPEVQYAHHWRNNSGNVQTCAPAQPVQDLAEHLLASNAALRHEPTWPDAMDLLKKCAHR